MITMKELINTKELEKLQVIEELIQLSEFISENYWSLGDNEFEDKDFDGKEYFESQVIAEGIDLGSSSIKTRIENLFGEKPFEPILFSCDDMHSLYSLSEDNQDCNETEYEEICDKYRSKWNKEIERVDKEICVFLKNDEIEQYVDAIHLLDDIQ